MSEISSTPPDFFQHTEAVLAGIQGKRLGLVVDFDGTISDIAPTPDEAVVYPESARLLAQLVPKLAVVAVVSGRAAADIHDKVGIKGVVYVGNHGAEYIYDGQHNLAPGASAMRGRLKSVFDHLRSKADAPGLVWEDKGLSTAVHYRQAPDIDDAARRLAEGLANAPGADELDVFWGKLVLEMRAPTGINKGYAMEKLVTDWRLESVIFVGDDTTDLDALRMLGDLRAQRRVYGARVVVLHQDSPAALLEAADYGVDGVEGVASLLGWLERMV